MMIGATLFSGIGSPETAMPKWSWAWCAENEKFPSAVLAARHASIPNLGNVKAHDFIARALASGRPDVVVFGSPCQDFSIAGRRRGMAGERGELTLYALGVVARLEPRWFVVENVTGLLSSDDGRDFDFFLRTVDDLGYSGAWASLDAQWFGLAQRRMRLFFVGHIGDWRSAATVLLEPESLCGDFAPSRSPGEGNTHDVASCLGASGRGFERAGETRGQDPVVAGPLNACGGTERKHGHGWGQQEFESGYAVPVLCPDVADPLIANEFTYSHEGSHNFRLRNCVAFGSNNTSGPIEIASAVNAHHSPHGRLDFGTETFVTNTATVRG